MNFTEWLESVNGKYIEVAGSVNAKNQCVDCANDYIKRVLGLPFIEWTNAINFPQHAGDKYEFIWNTPEALPPEGALMIFDIGIAGHISVFIEGNLIKFRSMDENYPLGSRCHVVEHNYNKVDGWLVLKSGIINDMTDQEERILQVVSENKLTEGNVRELAGWIKDGTMDKKDKQIQTLQAKVLDLDSISADMLKRIETLEGSIKANNELVSSWQKKVLSANKQVEKLSKQYDDMWIEKNKFKNYYEKALDKSADKLSAIELLRLLIKKLFKK